MFGFGFNLLGFVSYKAFSSGQIVLTPNLWHDVQSALGDPVVLDRALEIPAMSVDVCAGSNTSFHPGLTNLMVSAGTRTTCRT